MAICKACGAENAADATYCARCATRLDVETQQRLDERRAAHTATGVRWMSVVVTSLVAIVVIAVIVLLVVHVL